MSNIDIIITILGCLIPIILFLIVHFTDLEYDAIEQDYKDNYDSYQ